MAHHFESLSVAALPANLLALPAVAPAMWLGMLAAIAGQLPAIPVEPLNWLNSLLLAYIAQVARWLGEPGWAQVELGLGGPGALRLRGPRDRRASPLRRGGAAPVAAPPRAAAGLAPARRSALGIALAPARADGAARPRRRAHRPRACACRSSTSARATRSCSSPPGRAGPGRRRAAPGGADVASSLRAAASTGSRR